MSFLTIEKFSPHSRINIITKIIIVFILLVVSLIVLAAWVVFNISGSDAAQAAAIRAAGQNRNYQDY